MVVLALGTGAPQPACVAATPEAGMACCCTQSPVCQCERAKPCQQLCALAQVQALDKQIPVRVTFASSLHGDSFLYSIAPTKIKYLALVPVVHQRELNASPPFGGSPPQAVLCLWVI
jgi:hypothetical protein